MLAFRSLLIFSAIFRVALIAYGEWQDRHMEVRYTDVDYLVFSDAASLLASGESPYKRTTYRYSPLLAFILIPNSLLHASWGKLIFSASDILVGLLIHRILTKRSVPETLCNYSEVAWLLNPFTFTIGTRGNCEPIVSAILLWIILCLMNGKVVQGAIWYGLVVHLRIYPIVYALPIVICLDSNGGKYTCSKWDSHEKTILLRKSSVSLASVFCKDRILFGLVSGSVFFFLTAFFYYIYGYQFLNEALLYHLTRTDPRHNFSIYFYHIYLHSSNEFSVLEKLISFLPQLTVQLALVFSFAKDLPFCIFLQTLAFVAFNKVMTAQYFVWFFCLLPLIMPWSNIKIKWKGAFCMCLWMGGQLHWLLWGYMLEFKGENVFVALWLASIVFFGVNCFLIITFVYGHRFSSLFQKADKFD